MKTFIVGIIAVPALTITALFFSPSALASPTDTGVANNPGLQQNCAFNPAFNKAHAAACAGFDVEAVASNGADDTAAITAGQH